MAYIPLRNIGAGGLVPDKNPYDVELTQFPSGNNVSFENGAIGKTLGHTDVGITIPNAPVTVAGFLKTGSNNLFIGSRNNIYRFNGSSVTTVGTGYSNTSMWQTEQIGSGIIFNNSSDVPQYINTTTLSSNGNFSNLANWPSTLSTKNVKPYKSFLVMAGYTDTSGGGSDYNTRVRWSDEFDPSSVPTSYDVTSTTNLAGFNELGGENGNLLDQLTLGNTQIIYAERGVYAMDFIGAPLVFSFREIFSDDGIISRGACASWEGKHLVVGQNDIYVHDGNVKKSLSSLKVKDEFYKGLIDAESVFCKSVASRSEVWICYAVQGAVKDATDGKYSPNRCLVYNWDNDAFTFVDLPNTRSLSHGDAMSGGGIEGTWDDPVIATLPYSSSTKWWSNSSLSVVAEDIFLYSVDHTNSKLYIMNNSRGFSGSSVNCFLEATKIDLDTVLNTANNNIKQVMGIMPQIRGEGSVTILVGYSNTPQDPVSWYSTNVFNIDQDHKIDVRTSGRYLALRFESNENANFWNITGLDVDVREVSGR